MKSTGTTDKNNNKQSTRYQLTINPSDYYLLPLREQQQQQQQQSTHYQPIKDFFLLAHNHS
jgi:hypothetical protein